MSQLLSIKNLFIQFSNDGELNAAVQNISFDVHRGEIVLFVADSGWGKPINAI